jgi:hypothetical protein
VFACSFTIIEWEDEDCKEKKPSNRRAFFLLYGSSARIKFDDERNFTNHRNFFASRKMKEFD